MLRNALQEIVSAYRQQRWELPPAGGFIEQMPVEDATEARLVS